MVEQGEASTSQPILHKHKHVVGQDQSKVEEILASNRRVANSFMLSKCEKEAARNWNMFYKHHEDRFFKNKNWTDREFQELSSKRGEEGTTSEGNVLLIEEEMDRRGAGVLLEVGCGPGNMLYPVIASNPLMKAHCCDFSDRAVTLLKSNPLYDPERINAFVFDLVHHENDLAALVSEHPFGSPSIVSLIFVLSAIPPKHHREVFESLCRTIPIGGTFCFRDFARGDLTQIRFHAKASAAWCEPSLLSEDHDFYRRGDNTFTYFFSVEEIERIAESVGLEGVVEIKEQHGLNRKTGVQLHRRFIQGRWKKVRQAVYS